MRTKYLYALVPQCSLWPAEVIDQSREFIKLKDQAYPRCIREILYRLNALKDLTSRKAFLKRKAESDFTLTFIELFLKQFILATFGAFSSNDYFSYNTEYQHSVKDLIENYIGYFRRWEYRENLNDLNESYFLWNKIITNILLKINNLSSTNMCAIVFEGKYFSVKKKLAEPTSFDEIIKLNKGKFIYKPACGRWGREIGTFEIDIKNNSIKLNGKKSKIDDIQKGLINKSCKEPFIIEEMLINEKSIKSLSKNSLNTVRIMTIRINNDIIEPFAAAIRFSTSDGIIDNWSSGGLAASVDIYNGKIGKPLSNAVIKNRNLMENNSYRPCLPSKIPCWGNIVSLALKAHKIFKNMFSIGWDIAVTPNGPVLIEGNDDWDIVLPQRVLNKGLWETPFKKIINAKRFKNRHET